MAPGWDVVALRFNVQKAGQCPTERGGLHENQAGISRKVPRSIHVAWSNKHI